MPFETEKDLQDRGTAKTPDVLLSCPIAVEIPTNDGKQTNWKIINWIDSKALFGDADTHRQSLVPQAESYLHRFGPGLVLYWLGHAPGLNDWSREIVVSGELPSQFLLPNGEILHRQP